MRFFVIFFSFSLPPGPFFSSSLAFIVFSPIPPSRNQLICLLADPGAVRNYHVSTVLSRNQPIVSIHGSVIFPRHRLLLPGHLPPRSRAFRWWKNGPLPPLGQQSPSPVFFIHISIVTVVKGLSPHLPSANKHLSRKDSFQPRLKTCLKLKHSPPFQNHWIFMHFLLLLYLFSPLVKASVLCQIVISPNCFNVDFPVSSLLFTTFSRNHSSSAPQVVGMFPVIWTGPLFP